MSNYITRIQKTSLKEVREKGVGLSNFVNEWILKTKAKGNSICVPGSS